MAAKAGTLWMGDLEPYMDENFLVNSFKQMGESLMQAKIIKNKITGLPLGYGFLEFGDDRTALRVLHKCNGKMIPQSGPPKRFKLNHASYGKEQDFSIFVGDLTPDVDDLTLFNVFVARFPSTRSAKVVLDSQGVTKGYGFIRFAEEKDQQKALIQMQGSSSICGKPVRVSLATPKNRQTGQAPTETSPTLTPNSYSAYYQNAYSQYQDYYQSPSWQNYQQYYNSYSQQQYDQYYGQQQAAADSDASQYAQYQQYQQDPYASLGAQYQAAAAQGYLTDYVNPEAELEGLGRRSH